jgi:hypothetical protein
VVLEQDASWIRAMHVRMLAHPELRGEESGGDD